MKSIKSFVTIEAVSTLSIFRVSGRLKHTKINIQFLCSPFLFCLCKSICASFWVGPASWTDLIEKRSCITARNVFPPGPNQWTKKLLKCIFLIEGAHILQTAIDFHRLFFILLLCSLSITTGTCPAGHVCDCIYHAIHCMSSKLYRTQNKLRSSQDFLILTKQPHMHTFSFSLSYYMLFSHTNAL